MKLLTSISVSERASSQMKEEAELRLRDMYQLVDDELLMAKEHNKLVKQQQRESKFGM